VTFIGTATVLLRYAGFTVLTDPNFLHQGEHAPLGYGLRSRRLTEPAMQPDELPPIDFVVLSHHHGDHFDERAARELNKDLRIITTAHGARKLRRQGFRAVESLDTWQRASATKGDHTVTVTALQFAESSRPLLRLYISGDTIVHDHLHEIPQRYPDIHLALLHLGGTRILGVLLTMDAKQGVRALEITRPRHAIPIHYDDYTVFKSPLDDFRREVAASGIQTAIHYLDRGEQFEFQIGDLTG
jgi:L-ascorbate metabolism protein UlaG (beta-lactamase superfamily)